MRMDEKLELAGLAVPDIYLPAKNTDMRLWSVIACDQYSSEPEYWEKVKKLTGNAPSTLNLIYPECYLDEPDGGNRILSIQNSMKTYLDDGILESLGKGFILVKRTTPNSGLRWGLMINLDLDEYDYSPGSLSLIRATEGTILDRIPPRRKIREEAPLELPHIMVLIDDPQKITIEPLCGNTEEYPCLYDFDLMFDSGHVTGYHITGEKEISQIAGSLLNLMKSDGSSHPLLYAMGDGNHSLATAKAIWEDVKKTLLPDQKHPARYALVELVNLYDDGIRFEPIHRVLFGVDPEEALESFLEASGGYWNPADFTAGSEAKIEIVSSRLNGIITFPETPGPVFPTGIVQDWLDSYLPANRSGRLDYIHGSGSTRKLASLQGNIGFLLPAILKNTFFETIRSRGVFPRKTFSMGESWEKRFYIESRKIRE